MTIEERLERLEHRAALGDLVTRYFLAADGDDLDGVGASFTDDAVFASSGVTDATGREAIVAFIAGARAQMGLTVHTLNATLFTFRGRTEADGIVGAHLELVIGDRALFGAVRYQDGYRLTDTGWRIARRDMRVIHIAPWAEVDRSLPSAHPVRWPGGVPTASDYPRKTVAFPGGSGG